MRTKWKKKECISIWQIYKAGKTFTNKWIFSFFFHVCFACLVTKWKHMSCSRVDSILTHTHPVWCFPCFFWENFFVVVADLQLRKIVKTFAGMCIWCISACSMKCNNCERICSYYFHIALFPSLFIENPNRI